MHVRVDTLAFFAGQRLKNLRGILRKMRHELTVYTEQEGVSSSGSERFRRHVVGLGETCAQD